MGLQVKIAGEPCVANVGVFGCGTRMQYATVFSNLSQIFIKLTTLSALVVVLRKELHVEAF